MNGRRHLTFVMVAAVCLLLAHPRPRAWGAAPDFVREVRPILEQHCFGCHGPEKQKSGYRLDVRDVAFKGGDSGKRPIVPHDAKASLLVRYVTGENKDMVMPPKGERLNAGQIKVLQSWINSGAVWPAAVGMVKAEDKRDHWSFKPVLSPVPPATRNKTWARCEVDRFILARLEKAGLRPAPEADRVTWLRRVSFDLVGLPPSPEQVETFVQDRSGDAYERVVDELLASPRYGERWAQHWLDVVRYADTHGFEVNTERPNAWPYRDYVIRAFNNDTPYDRFIREQLVGDALGEDAATGFLITASVLLPGQIGADDVSKRLARQDSLDEIVVNIGQTFLGLSIGCARCHDHKFDPISARDYYAMQAFVAGVEYEDREMRTPETEAKRAEEQRLTQRMAEVERQLSGLSPLAKSGAERPPVNARMNTDRFAPVKAKRVRFTIRETNNLEPCIDELEVFDTSGANVALASVGTKVTSSGDTVVADRHELRFVNDGNYGNSRSWMSNERDRGWVVLELAREQTVDRVIWGRDRKGEFTDRLATNYVVEVADGSGEWNAVADSSDRATSPPSEKAMPVSLAGLSTSEAKEATRLMDEKKSLEGKIHASAEGRLAFAGKFRTPDKVHLLSRGDPEQPKDEVVPAVLSVLGSTKLARDTSEQERRRALAGWIASPENPLTARVMVNRIWQGHFGAGLVDTPSDFGRNGAKPTHPELLDWLASEFIRSGWSVKHMHRLIVLSATYRQSAKLSNQSGAHAARKLNTDSMNTDNSSAQAKDTDVRLLWRFPSRRLESEAIRDAMLAVSGKLNLQMYGRGFDLFSQRGGLSGFNPIESFKGDGLRRMIYAHKVRREREAVFGAFDCPDAGQSTARRRESTTPIQALNLFNSRFTLEQADAFTARVKAEAGDDLTEQISRAYQLALSRRASAAELAEARPVVVEHGLPVLCRALFNSNEFLFMP